MTGAIDFFNNEILNLKIFCENISFIDYYIVLFCAGYKFLI